ncbi:MAG: PKD domain-containing protein, partial [Merismopedia sp. SIO2A8]|nr:PKD domain-containing protein [Merismopedia sp. SIO2A8]
MFQGSTAKTNSSKYSPTQISSTQVNFTEVSLSSSISLQQFLRSHTPNPQNTTVANWTNFLQPHSPFNLNIEITDLPTGQLAEATITRFDSIGRPIAGTILIDDDANGLGWFIDPTPWDNSEYHPHQTDTLLKATPDSPAHGRYDLLTTVLHELGHLAGIIHGNPAYNDRIQYINGTPTFIGNGYTAKLTHDLSHLADPTQLMSPYLAPGIRKLPSQLELQILADLRNTLSERLPASTTISAAHGAQPLIGITNGDFEQLLDHWNQRGAIQPTQTGSSTAITLTEDSPILSQLSQTFIIPDDPDQQFLTFDLLETDLNHSNRRPPDAFEIALLDNHSHTPLVGTIQDSYPSLTHTDALLNLQANGTLYTDDNVTVTPLGNGHRRVKIDLSDVAPGTIATLYFDLLGFGTPDSHITLDNIAIGKGNTPPVATNDTATLSQGDTLALDLLSNDLDPDQPLTSSNIHSTTQPLHGTLSRNNDGTLIYRPHDGYIGTDQFTYTLRDSDGELSAPATVQLDISNRAPEIETLTLPQNPTEGSALSFSATATDPGNDTLTYTWDFGDNSVPITGATTTHSYADNGTYIVTLTVTDPHGGTTTQSETLIVINVAPTITEITSPTTLNEGELGIFEAIATDPGDDTLTYTWSFGDGSDPVTGTNVTHTYADNGNYTVTLTVEDEDGGVTVEERAIAVTNVSPTITNINHPITLNEGESGMFEAIATDPGDDTLTYTWSFGDGSEPVTGANATHTYADNGNYTVTLTVEDEDGGVTVEERAIAVTNVAPAITNINHPITLNEGESGMFEAIATDPGDDTLTYSWDFGDGSDPVIGTNATHTYTDNGNYTVTLTVEDEDGGVTVEERAIAVTNVSPTITNINHPITLNEGESGMFEAIATDPGDDTLTYTWSFGDGSTFTTGPDATHTYSDNGIYNATLTVTDDDGGITTESITVTVHNVAPTITEITRDTGVKLITDSSVIQTARNAGEKLWAIDGRSGGRTTYEFAVGPNGAQADLEETAEHTWENGQPVEWSLKWDDDTVIFTVNGQAMTYDIGDDALFNALSIYTKVNTSSANRVAEGTRVELDIHAVNGEALDEAISLDSIGPDNGQDLDQLMVLKDSALTTLSGTARLSWSDDAPNPHSTNSQSRVTFSLSGYQLDDVDQAIELSTPFITTIDDTTEVNEGSPLTLSATATDPGDDTLTYTWDFGDGSTSTTGPDATHTYSDNGIYNATLTVTDDDGGITTESITVTVHNVAPTITDVYQPIGTHSISDSQIIQTVRSSGQKLWAMDGRAGGITTYEFAIGPNGAQSDLAQQAEHTWENGEPVEWTLNWNDDTVIFTINGQTMTYDIGDNALFNALSIYTKVNTTSANRVAEGTRIELNIHSVNGETLDEIVSLESLGPNHGQDLDQLMLLNAHSFATLSGTTRLFWPDDAPNPHRTNSQSRVTFSFSGYQLDDINSAIKQANPIVSSIYDPITVDDVTSVALGGTDIDSGDDTLPYTSGFDNSSDPVTGVTSTHTYADNGTHTATLTVEDGDGDITTQTVSVTVNNIAPVSTLAEPVPIAAEQIISFNASISDPDILDTYTIEWDFGDGTTATGSLNPSHIYHHSGRYTVTLSITDSNGATTTETLSMNVDNPASTIAAEGRVNIRGTNDFAGKSFNGKHNTTIIQ